MRALDQQRHARRRGAVQTFKLQFGAQQRLDPPGARRLVELDGAEQVAEVGDGERGLLVGCGAGHDLVDAVGSIDDGKLGVQAQMDKHPGIVGSRPPPAAPAQGPVPAR